MTRHYHPVLTRAQFPGLVRDIRRHLDARACEPNLGYDQLAALDLLECLKSMGDVDEFLESTEALCMTDLLAKMLRVDSPRTPR